MARTGKFFRALPPFSKLSWLTDAGHVLREDTDALFSSHCEPSRTDLLALSRHELELPWTDYYFALQNGLHATYAISQPRRAFKPKD
jgi:hypothetical protein